MTVQEFRNLDTVQKEFIVLDVRDASPDPRGNSVTYLTLQEADGTEYEDVYHAFKKNRPEQGQKRTFELSSSDKGFRAKNPPPQDGGGGASSMGGAPAPSSPPDDRDRRITRLACQKVAAAILGPLDQDAPDDYVSAYWKRFQSLTDKLVKDAQV